MTKQELRAMIRQRSKEHPTPATLTMNDLTGGLSPCEVNTLLLYSALPDEVQTQQLMDCLVDMGKTVLLPRVVSDTDMELRRYTGRHDLERGAFGIMEPTGERFNDYTAIDTALIPGMAFDREGHRLGRGKGYYDRFLSQLIRQNPHCLKIGICASWQLVDCVPTDAHDIVMDRVVECSTLSSKL